MVKVFVQRDYLNKRTYVLDKTNNLCYTTKDVARAPTVFSIFLSMITTATLFAVFSLYIVYNVGKFIFFAEFIFLFVSTFIIRNIEKRNFLKRCFLFEVIKGSENLKKDMHIKRCNYITNFIAVLLLSALCLYCVKITNCDLNNRLTCFLFITPLAIILANYLDKSFCVKTDSFVDDDIK